MNQSIKRLVEFPEVKSTYGEYTQLAVQLFDFFHYKFSIECIPIITITVEEVSKAIGVEESYLNEVMEINEKINNHQQFIDRGFETVFEYVLFLMFSKNIVFAEWWLNLGLETSMDRQVGIYGMGVIRSIDLKFDYDQKSYDLTFDEDFYDFLIKF